MKLGYKALTLSLKTTRTILVSLTATMGLFMKIIEAAVLIHLLEAIFNKLAEL